MSDLVEQVARAIHDVLENDDDSKGGGYMRAARAALSVLEPRIEALERELAAMAWAERERCARIAEDLHKADALGEYYRGNDIAAAIRNGERG